jgi:hypothetical protein
VCVERERRGEYNFGVKDDIWLSQGGKLTLIKEVLEAISIYWFLLATFPKESWRNLKELVLIFSSKVKMIESNYS